MVKNILITGASGLCGNILSEGLTKLGYKIIGWSMVEIIYKSYKNDRIQRNF